MAELAANGSFENAGFGWTAAGGTAFQAAVDAQDGTEVVELTSIGTSQVGSVLQPIYGAASAFTFYYRRIGTGYANQDLKVFVNGVEDQALAHAVASTSWTQATVTLLPTDQQNIEIRAVGSAGSDTAVWEVDTVVVTGTATESIRLAERGADAIVALLQAKLPSELPRVEVLAGNDIHLPLPNQYHKRPKQALVGGPVWLEVYETTFDLENPYSDASAQRVTHDIEYTVRVTFAKRDGTHGADDMTTRMRRYSVALFNVFNRNPLFPADDRIRISSVDAVEPFWDAEGEDADQYRKVSATIMVTLRGEEAQ